MYNSKDTEKLDAYRRGGVAGGWKLVVVLLVGGS
jgi:hypothetical protein